MGVVRPGGRTEANMRILMVHNDYGSPSGEEHAAAALAGLLQDHGQEVRWFRRSSAEIVGSPLGSAKAFFAGIHNPFAARALARKLDELRPDLVQVQNLYPLLSPSIFKPIRERGIPIVMRCPNYRLFCPNGRHLVKGQVCEKCLSPGREIWCVLRNCEGNFGKSAGYALRNAWARISRRILQSVDVFIVQTDFQKQRFAERGIPEDQIGIVPALVPCNGLAEPRPGGELVTFVGRVSPEKGIDDFVCAARLMPDTPFAIAGDDSAMPGLRETSPENVTWLGFLQSDALNDLYLRSRVIVVPSRWYEGFPNVLARAMVCARPVVAARIGAMTCIVDDNKTGFFFEVGDSNDLAEKLKALFKDRELCNRFGQAGRAKALAQYSPANIYAALTDVYDKALTRRVH
jgi:glycosyltransferase involved in cell wall biosynthesis